MATSNGHYAAYNRGGKVYVEGLTSSARQDEPRCLLLPDVAAHSVLSLSTLKPYLLAISSGAQILVCDVIKCKIQKTLEGTGRTVTALGWSAAQPYLLLSGAIDGSLSLWDLDSDASGAPIAQLRLDGVCEGIQCSPTDSSIIASMHDGGVVVSKRVSRTSLRPLWTIKLEDDAITSLSWHQEETGRLLTGAQNGRICLWDLRTALATMTRSTDTSDSNSSDGEDGFFGNLAGLDGSVQQVSDVVSGSTVMQVLWAGKNGFLCLAQHGKRCSLWSWQEGAPKAAELWSDQLHETADSISIVRQDESAVIVVVSVDGLSKVVVPQNIATHSGMVLLSECYSMPSADPNAAVGQQNSSMERGMIPLSISTLRASHGSFTKSSKQLRHRKPSFERRGPKQGKRVSQTTRHKRAASHPPLSSMTSSLELPKPTDDEGSPMPFLSPSIPSQQPSPGDFSALDDDVKLPPLPRASLDSSVQSASAATQESDDSDDETFVDGMQGSASFLPGGINVPLPKACAALFTPTGELLTFFPPKPKLASRREQALGERHHDPKANAKKVAKLFPSFGNLAAEPAHLLDDDDDSGFQSTSSASVDAGPLGPHPSFSFYPASFPSQPSWKARISPTKHSFTEQSPHKVIVSLHEIDDVSSLLPASRQLASQYRILCDRRDSGAELCHYNAGVASTLGLVDVAGIWRLVAVLLENSIPLEAIAGSRSVNNISAMARAASDLVLTGMSRPRPDSRQRAASGKLRRTNSPLGAAWVVHAIFEWAESRADIQLLAVISSILAQAELDTPEDVSAHAQSITKHSPTHRQDYFASAHSDRQSQKLADQPIPVLRTGARPDSNTVYESPIKPKRSSTASSRNPSQPSTPYVGSESTTPPFPLPPFGRQGSRLSVSGSASPEYHRSSFSAAAKYYAQSISDKFASYGAYGTSPPARKTGTSPNNLNELSTSFPSGSWGKSVSFASTTTTNTKASLLSTSFEDAHEDEGYDSDKTVEDLSQPQTPKDTSDCIVTMKNDHVFDDDISGGSSATFLSQEMVPQCRRWCEFYAEQLRCWDLVSQAAELENVCGTTSLRSPTSLRGCGENDGIMPVAAPHGSKVCSICSIRMTRAQFFCPSCLHGAHLSCLEDFAMAICVEDDQAFACPSGCGCVCDDLPCEVVDAEAVKEEKPKKKASFTDPRRWRARVEGDSW